MTPGGTPAENAGGRLIPRHHGPAVRHVVRFYRTDPANPGFRDGGLRAVCTCGDARTVNGGSTITQLSKLARQHSTGKP